MLKLNTTLHSKSKLVTLAGVDSGHKIPEFHNFKMLFLEQRAALQNVLRYTTHEIVLLMKAFSSRGSRCRCLPR